MWNLASIQRFQHCRAGSLRHHDPHYTVGGEPNPPTTPGLTGLRARDGGNAWHAATGEPNSQVPPVEVNGVIYTEGFSEVPQIGWAQWLRCAPRMGISSGRRRYLPEVDPRPRFFRIATDGVTVLVADPTAGLYALAATTGAVRWHLNATSDLAACCSKNGVAVATLTDPQGAKAHMAVYREDDGQLLWQRSDFSAGATSEAINIGINHTAVYIAGQTELVAYAARTGAQLWSQQMGGGIVGVDDHTITIGFFGGRVGCLDAAMGSVIWKREVLCGVE